MSRFLRLKALETLARYGAGANRTPWRERRARGRACRGGRGRTRRYGALPPPMARAAGAGTRLPRRERAHAAGPWQVRPHGGPIPRYTIPNTPRHTASRRAAYILGYTTQPIGRNHRRMRQAAFLAAEGRSQRSRAACTGQPRPHGASGGRGDAPAAAEAGARGGPEHSRPHGASGGTSTARYAGAWPGKSFAAPPHRRLPQAAFLASFGRSQRSQQPPPLSRSPQKTAHATASEGRGWDPPESERIPSIYCAQRGRPLTAAARARRLYDCN